MWGKVEPLPQRLLGKVRAAEGWLAKLPTTLGVHYRAQASLSANFF